MPGVQCRENREQEVVRLWRSSHISEPSIGLYLEWVRRYRVYCDQYGLDETSELTEAGAIRFGQAYIGPRTKGPLSESSRFCARKALHAWAWALRSLGIGVPQWRQRQPAPVLSPLIEAYCHYRLSVCGVAQATLCRDIETVNAFLSSLRVRGKAVSRAAATDIDGFIVEISSHVSRSTAADTCSSLRAFLRFLQTTGRIHRDLASCVTAPRVRRPERPPRALPWTDVRRILQAVPRSQPPGKRDFAMLLVMATYGLGAAEVLGLHLDDVDWNAQVLRIRRPKTGVKIDLPLLPAVGSALAAYLEFERPNHAGGRRIFLSRGIPHEPITSGAIRHRIRHYAQRAGVTADLLGAHIFRHSYASRQIDSGADLKVVSDILGHRRPSSTSVYVRVAIRRLRMVALPVPS
jgi:integrase/recombinase XerD